MFYFALPNLSLFLLPVMRKCVFQEGTSTVDGRVHKDNALGCQPLHSGQSHKDVNDLPTHFPFFLGHNSVENIRAKNATYWLSVVTHRSCMTPTILRTVA